MRNIDVLRVALLRHPEKKNLKQLAAELGMSYNTLKSRIKPEQKDNEMFKILRKKYGVVRSEDTDLLILKLEKNER